jgi:hypothetical protein
MILRNYLRCTTGCLKSPFQNLELMGGLMGPNSWVDGSTIKVGAFSLISKLIQTFIFPLSLWIGLYCTNNNLYSSLTVLSLNYLINIYILFLLLVKDKSYIKRNNAKNIKI